MREDIPLVSAELEFPLAGVAAGALISMNGLPLVHEVNPESVVELNVSMHPDIEALNDSLATLVSALVANGQGLGGTVYGGSSVLADTSGLEPRWHRTTSLSLTLARGLMDITSQQVVIGVRGERLGFDLFNYLLSAQPAMHAMSASSPFVAAGDSLVDTGSESRRIAQYDAMLRRLPSAMLKAPLLRDSRGYARALQEVSDDVNRRLAAGDLDANTDELYKERPGGAYAPFATLLPHQVYWKVRPRPDHGNGECDLSLEVRACDMPTTVDRMQMVNCLAIGLAYRACDAGIDALPALPEDGSLNRLRAASRDPGAYAEEAAALARAASLGLEDRGYRRAASQLRAMSARVLAEGTDASIIRKARPSTPSDLTHLLAERLCHGE